MRAGGNPISAQAWLRHFVHLQQQRVFKPSQQSGTSAASSSRAAVPELPISSTSAGSVRPPTPRPETREADPLNRGALVLGGGAEQQHLYRGGFQDIRIVHDLYYNANLRTLRVGSGDPIPVPPLDASRVAAMGSNALLDTGCSFLVLEAGTHAAVMDAFAAADPRLPDLVEQSRRAFANGSGLEQHAVHALDWPDLHFGFEAPDGATTEVRVPASQYWPRNALKPGQTLCLLAPALAHFGGQSILGLPLFAGRYAVFDRDRAGGAGVVRLASSHG